MDSSGILKKTVLAGLGIYSLTKEKAQEIMNDLVEKGELSKDEGPTFVKTLMQKADEELEFLKKAIDSRVDQALTRFKPTYEEEFKKLNQKIDSLAKEIQKISSR
ncbi:MAG: phasin family protein [bacterium]